MKLLFALVVIGVATAIPTPERLLEKTCRDYLDQSGTDYGFFPDIDSCGKYFQCYRVVVHGVTYYHNRINDCPEQTVWNQLHQTCQWDLNGNGCEIDPCDYSAAPFADNANCGSYYVCVNSDPIKMCCPPGLGYNPVSRLCDAAGCGEICDTLDLYNDTDTNGTNPNITALADDECLNGNHIYSVYMVKDGVSKYHMADLDRVNVANNVCPHDAPLFSLQHCGCIRSSNSVPAGSVAEKCYTYDYTNTFGMLKDGTSHWVQVHNAHITNGALCMTANGLAEIPFFSSNSFGSHLRLGFKMDVSSVDMMSGTILSNGDALTTPTIEVKIDSGDLVITVLADITCTLRQPFNEGSSTATVTYDGQELAVNIAQGLISQPMIRMTPCSGPIQVSRDPMRLGFGFTGCLDDVTICKN